MPKTIRGWGIAILLVGAMGCSHATKLERVRDLEMTAAKTPKGWDGATVEIDPFEDDRPEEAWVVGYNRVRYEHPEHAHAFGEERVVRVGDLEDEYPALLARTLPPGAQVSLGAAGTGEFIVRGRLLQSTLSSRIRPMLAVPALLGIPVARHDIQLRVQVELYRAGAVEPLWREIYVYQETKREGLYYGLDGSRKLARAALRDSVERAAKDVAAVIAANRSARSLEAPPEPT